MSFRLQYVISDTKKKKQLVFFFIAGSYRSYSILLYAFNSCPSNHNVRFVTNQHVSVYLKQPEQLNIFTAPPARTACLILEALT